MNHVCCKSIFMQKLIEQKLIRNWINIYNICKTRFWWLLCKLWAFQVLRDYLIFEQSVLDLVVAWVFKLARCKLSNKSFVLEWALRWQFLQMTRFWHRCHNNRCYSCCSCCCRVVVGTLTSGYTDVVNLFHVDFQMISSFEHLTTGFARVRNKSPLMLVTNMSQKSAF